VGIGDKEIASSINIYLNSVFLEISTHVSYNMNHQKERDGG
jgi:hypothetical protein